MYYLLVRIDKAHAQDRHDRTRKVSQAKEGGGASKGVATTVMINQTAIGC